MPLTPLLHIAGLATLTLTVACGGPLDALDTEDTRAAASAPASFTIAPGETLAFRVRGASTDRLASSRAYTVSRGRASVSSELSVALSGATRDGRWVEVQASRAASLGTFSLDGLPASITVVARSRNPTSAGASARPADVVYAGRPIDPNVTTRTLAGRGTRALTTELWRADESLVPVINPDGSISYQSRGGGSVSVATSPNTQVSSVVPESGASVGGTVEINGHDLPSACAIHLGAMSLTLVSKSPTQIIAQLPEDPTTGDLVLVRTDDPASALLVANYQVSLPTEPRAFDHFDADANKRTWPEAYLLSLLSMLAYSAEGTVQAQAQAWGLTLADGLVDEVTWFFYDPDDGAPTGSTQAAVLYNDDVVIVAFRGSTTLDWAQDWIDNDLDFVPVFASDWGPGVMVHHGFYEATDVAYAQVLDKITPLLAGRRLWLTGHSLGGALATLTAFRLEHDEGIEVQGVHMFGAPSVGNAAFSQAYAENVANTHRWNVQQDPVPVLLPWPAFTHVGTRNNLYLDGKVELDDAVTLFYIPVIGPPALKLAQLIYNLMYTHNSYLARMYEELEERYPGLAAELPQPPADM